MVHIYDGLHYSAIRKDEILPLVTKWMNLENIMLSEVNQLKKDKNHMISIIGGINNKATSK